MSQEGSSPLQAPKAWGRALFKENLLPPHPLRGLPWLLRENQDSSGRPQCGPQSDPVCGAHPREGSVQRDWWGRWSGRFGAPAVLTQVTEELERSEPAWHLALLPPGAGDMGLGPGTPSCLGQPQSLCPDLGSVPTEGPALLLLPWVPRPAFLQPLLLWLSWFPGASPALAGPCSSLKRVQTRSRSFGKRLKPQALLAKHSDFPGAHSALS